MSRVSVTEFAAFLGVSKQRASALIAEGMPAEPPSKRGAARMLDTAAAIDWLLRRERQRAATPDGGESLPAAALRKARADADLAEQRVAEAANLVIPLADAESLIERVMVLVATQLDGMAGRIAATVAEQSDAAACRQVIFDECRRARDAMAAEFEACAAAEETAAGHCPSPDIGATP